MDYTTTFRGYFLLDKPLDAGTTGIINNLRSAGLRKADDNNGNSSTYSVETTEPSGALHWCYNDKQQCIQWDGDEYFSDYVTWLKYLINQILSPTYVLNGSVTYQGDNYGDRGCIIVKNNKVIFKYHDEN